MEIFSAQTDLVMAVETKRLATVCYNDNIGNPEMQDMMSYTRYNIKPKTHCQTTHLVVMRVTLR